MNINTRIIVTSLLLLFIIISFALIIAEVMAYSSVTDISLEESTSNTATPLKDTEATKSYKIKAKGTLPTDLKKNTMYYRYGSLIFHVLAIMSSIYLTVT